MEHNYRKWLQFPACFATAPFGKRQKTRPRTDLPLWRGNKHYRILQLWIFNFSSPFAFCRDSFFLVEGIPWVCWMSIEENPLCIWLVQSMRTENLWSLAKMLISWKIKMLQIQLMYSGEKKGPLTPHNTAHGLPYLWDFNVMESLFLLSPVHFLAIESGHSYQVENEFSTWSTIFSMTAKCVRRSHKLLSIIIYSFAN